MIENAVIINEHIINELVKKMDSKSQTSTPLDWSKVFNSSNKGSSDNDVILLATIEKEKRNKSRIENNIVLSGVIESENDTLENQKVDEILIALNLKREDVAKQTRLKKRNRL